MATEQTGTTHITPDDLQRKFQAVQDSVQGRVEDEKSTLTTIAIGGGIVLLLLFFLLGKRAGKKKSAIIEIRRV